jgi:hypothetical protein
MKQYNRLHQAKFVMIGILVFLFGVAPTMAGDVKKDIIGKWTKVSSEYTYTDDPIGKKQTKGATLSKGRVTEKRWGDIEFKQDGSIVNDKGIAWGDYKVTGTENVEVTRTANEQFMAYKFDSPSRAPQWRMETKGGGTDNWRVFIYSSTMTVWYNHGQTYYKDTYNRVR